MFIKQVKLGLYDRHGINETLLNDNVNNWIEYRKKEAYDAINIENKRFVFIYITYINLAFYIHKYILYNMFMYMVY